MALPITRIVLDGEAVAHCPEGSRTSTRSYAALAALERASTPSTCCRSDAEDLRGLALVERRALAPQAPQARRRRDHLQRAPDRRKTARRCSVTPAAMGLEGIVSKRVDSRYKSGRCLRWVKVKNPGLRPDSG